RPSWLLDLNDDFARLDQAELIARDPGQGVGVVAQALNLATERTVLGPLGLGFALELLEIVLHAPVPHVAVRAVDDARDGAEEEHDDRRPGKAEEPLAHWRKRRVASGRWQEMTGYLGVTRLNPSGLRAQIRPRWSQATSRTRSSTRPARRS